MNVNEHERLSIYRYKFAFIHPEWHAFIDDKKCKLYSFHEINTIKCLIKDKGRTHYIYPFIDNTCV
jgi:hypothetical protein